MTRLARLALSLLAMLALLVARPASATASTRAALDACIDLATCAELAPAASTPVSPGCAERSPSSARASTAKGETDGAQRALAREHRRVGASSFPHGETWIDQANSSEALPYLFTGKELDQETGLYYFGARYYDPQTALWQSADPALNDFLSRTSITPSQLSLYSYSYNNPIILKDPDGREPEGISAAESWHVFRVPGGGATRADLQTLRKADLAAQETTTAVLASVAASRATGPAAAVFDAVTKASALLQTVTAATHEEAAAGAASMLLAKAISARSESPVRAEPGRVRPGTEQPIGGAGKVLRDGEGASVAEMKASVGGPTGGTRQGQSAVRQRLLDETPAGQPYVCWRCGTQSMNPRNMHLGHRNVPTSRGGNLSSANTCLEGAACNLSAGNRGAPSAGMSCAERGGCGAPYGRTD